MTVLVLRSVCFYVGFWRVCMSISVPVLVLRVVVSLLFLGCVLY